MYTRRRILMEYSFKTQSLKAKDRVFPFYNDFFKILGTCPQLKVRPRLNPYRARIDPFTPKCSINLKLQLFLDFWKGLTTFLGQNAFSFHLWTVKIDHRINQILAIEVSYKFLKTYNIMSFSLTFEFFKCY